MPIDDTSANPQAAGLSAERLALLDSRLKQYVDEQKIAGILALLVRNGKCGYLGCHGTADAAARRAIQPGTLFRIYSMTKPITAAAVAALWDDGLLHFDDPIQRYLPEFENLVVFTGQQGEHLLTEPIRRPITIHDLLTHTSGLAYGLEPFSPVDVLYQQERLLRGDETLADKMARLAKLPLLHQPGERVTYSISFDVLSRLVEVITGQPFDRFLQDRFFDPLHMPDTTFHLPPANLERLAGIDWVQPGQPLTDLRPLAWLGLPDLPEYLCREWVDKSRPMRFLSGGGGLVSSAEDYLHFAQMLANHGEWQGTRILSQAAVEKMTTNQLSPALCPPGLGSGYGLGVLTDPALVGLPASKGAFGGGGAAGTDFWVDPGTGMIGILMVQMIPGGAYPVAQEFKFLAAQAVA
jgi:CubicO group peptidase (beta-lactamase class C family)